MDEAPPMSRPGPRPLPLHLARATFLWTSSLAALPLARSGSLPWSPPLAPRAAALQSALAGAGAEALTRALGREAQRRIEEMLAGIEAYRRHPYRRRRRARAVVWRDGTTVLRDHAARNRDAAPAMPVLVVPSLVNRGYILDLSARRSLLGYLAGRGLRPLLVDWGEPGEEERGFTIGDYVTRRLEPALDAAVTLAGGPVAVVGYCMGGLLALALALRRQRDIRGLALLATPWDFHAGHGAHARLLGAGEKALDALLERQGVMPVDLLQTMFTWLDPALVADKFRAFAALDQSGRKAEDFVALEDWLNDGVPLAAPAAREAFTGWYGSNLPGRGEWRVDGRRVDPAALEAPSLVVLPRGDRIVPPASAEALAAAIPGAERLEPRSGHIGMIVGSAARDTLWRPLAAWLLALD
jgi:polyhydroxyalkanoate synthase